MLRKSFFFLFLLSIIGFHGMSFGASLHGEQINIDGHYGETRSSTQKLKLLRKKLEKRNEQMIRKKIAKIRIMNELKLQKQLQAIMNKQLAELDKIN